ncbi:WD domain G-beta repeat [Carpediemonas membranifera]|uniref:WD domain G-beta repeat n=1 Tax=Carpediemonas membranifera TaxID=201153 RepID=A0A8J6BAC2_9EUKA|nr:WD domain G-beta repeat [Carpediemonas membranifera]|eukprot:KAG9393252.1 WD domain G-beta repeat [Carpediemonas membranifera]
MGQVLSHKSSSARRYCSEVPQKAQSALKTVVSDDPITAVGMNGTIIVGCADGSLSVCSMDDLSLKRTVRLAPSSVSSMAVAPDHSRLAVALRDGSIHILDSDLAPVATIPDAHEMNISALCFKDATTLFSGSRDNSVVLWTLTPAPDRISQFKVDRNIVTVLCISPSDGTVIQGSEDLTLHVLAPATLEEVSTVELGNHFPHCMAKLDESRIVMGQTGFNGDGSELLVLNCDTMAIEARWAGHQYAVKGVGCVGRRVVSASRDMTVRLWDEGFAGTSEVVPLASAGVALVTGPDCAVSVCQNGALVRHVVKDGRMAETHATASLM